MVVFDASIRVVGIATSSRKTKGQQKLHSLRKGALYCSLVATFAYLFSHIIFRDSYFQNRFAPYGSVHCISRAYKTLTEHD
jgi:hypothetical protein